jgi:hypothetical protein
MLSELAPVCAKLLRLIENQRASGLYSLLLSASHLMYSGEICVATGKERMASSESDRTTNVKGNSIVGLGTRKSNREVLENA